jgi:hypothetical protein
MIAKRLYLLESSLVEAELYAPVYFRREYEAATISFIPAGEGTPATIIDSASGFIAADFRSGMALEIVGGNNDRSLLPIDAVESGAISIAEGFDVVAFSEGTACAIKSRPDVALLPSDFWGMIDFPRATAQPGTLLDPVPNKTVAAYYEDKEGPLRYYKLFDGYMRLYPGAVADGFIKGPYFQRPQAVRTMDDVIPYNGLFDEVITEYAIAALAGGAPASAAASESIIGRAVDLVVQKMGKKAPIRQTGGIDWEAMHE